MKFVEMNGKTLMEIVNSDEFSIDELRAAGVEDDSVVRVNQHGDIEVRKRSGWDVIGGLLGDFHQRIRKRTGMDWS